MLSQALCDLSYGAPLVEYDVVLCVCLPRFQVTATTDPQQQPQQQQQLRHLLAANNKPSSLTVAGPDCIEAFYNTTANQYATDDDCTFLVNQAFAATALNKCPLGGTAAGSPLHKCLQKTAVSAQNLADRLS
jgi:hypothetical protein